MKGCTVLCLVLIISLSVDLTEGKEVIDSDTEEATNLLTKKLWTQIKKRLKDYGYDDHDLEDLDHELGAENDCSYDLVNGTIIRTHDSISQGATYISSPEIESREQCMQECCAMDNCNVAVFKENEEDHSCYLFDCGTPNICLFTSHPGYTVIKLPSRITSDKVQDKHEDDLENLAVETTTTTKPTTTTTTTAPVTEPEIKEPVSLFGRCTEHKDCAGSWSQCLGGYCVCKDSYHEQEGTCRKDCSKFEFECRNTGQPLAYPQCIAIYNKCDGIALCRDSSDEDSCDNDDAYGGAYNQPQQTMAQKPPPPVVVGQQPPQQPIQQQHVAVPQQQPVYSQDPGAASYGQMIQNYGSFDTQLHNMQSQSGVNQQQPQQFVQVPQQQVPVANPQQSFVGPPAQNQNPGVIYPQQANWQSNPQPVMPAQQQQPIQQNYPQQPVQSAPYPNQQLDMNVPHQQPIQSQTGNYVPSQIPAQSTGRKQMPEEPKFSPPYEARPLSRKQPDAKIHSSSTLGRDGIPPIQDGRQENKFSPSSYDQKPATENKSGLKNQDEATFESGKMANTGQEHISVNEAKPKTNTQSTPSHMRDNYLRQGYDSSRGGIAPSYGPSYNRNHGKYSGDNYGSKGYNSGYGNGGYQQNRGYYSNNYQPDRVPPGGRGQYVDYEQYLDNGDQIFGALEPNSDYDYYPLEDTDHPTNSKPSANTNTKPDKVDHPLLEPVNEKPAVDQDEPSEPSKSQDVTENKVISSSGSVSESEEDAIKPDPETSKSVEKSSSSDSSSDSITDDQPKTNPVNEKDPVDKSKPQDGKSDSAGKDADIEVVETAKEAESSDQGNSDNFLVETQEIQQLRHEGDLEKAEEDSGTLSRFYRSNKGAVVALSLGLTITAMLLVFVGCRLRNVKKKLRRGRPLNSNEADYLINGMYL